MRRWAVACLKAIISLSPLLALPATLMDSVLAQSDESLKKESSWNWPTAATYQDHLSSFLDQRQAGAELRSQVQRQWLLGVALRGPELLDHLLDTAGLVEPRLVELNASLRSLQGPPFAAQDYPWLSSDIPGWLQDAVRLACGRSLAQRRMYDEALEILGGLELGQICDPASLLFYRATAEHCLLKKAECLNSLKLLLERESELPKRYRQLAHLMRADIDPLEQDSLDEIARMMTDVHRRLDLGRAGQVVRDQEAGIIDKLDKLIEQAEQQAQQMQQQAGGGQGQGQGQRPQQSSGQPMKDSQVAGGSGPGDVDPKANEGNSSWGNLPPAQRQEALQRLTEELPSHYRDVIEGYFRQLAKDRSSR
ncbi:MAG: hypothetical protein KF752_05915 [Pirellulaceae bacterium]|nr:hypothetical protein [Pirellulaceae bacterium]